MSRMKSLVRKWEECGDVGVHGYLFRCFMSTTVQVHHTRNLERGANSAPERRVPSNLDIRMETVC